MVSRDPERLALGVVWGLALAHGLVDALVAIMVGPWSLRETREEQHQLQQIEPAPGVSGFTRGFFRPNQNCGSPTKKKKDFHGNVQQASGRRPPHSETGEEKKGIDLWVRGASSPAQLDDGDDERGARG